MGEISSGARQSASGGSRFLRIAILGALASVFAVGGEPALEFVQAQSFAAVFQLNDGPGPWFRCSSGRGCVAAGTQSLAVVSPGSVVRFIGGSETETVHTTTSLLWPLTAGGDNADNMPFDQAKAFRGAQAVTLNTPGLYVFVCKLHPFMLAAVIVDDASTEGLDLGEQVRLVNGLTVPTLSDLGVRLLRAFWVITNPQNYQDHNPATNPGLAWKVNLPAVDVRVTGGAVISLAALSIDTTVDPPLTPAVAGVGEVWVDTEY